MLSYDEPVIRPPAEADSLILQATIGCSHNRCAFCITYKNKKFRARPVDELFAEIDWAKKAMPGTLRVFLGDGDALALSTDKILAILEKLDKTFPKLRKVSTYASPGNFARKTVKDLERLRDAGLSQVYVGFESGDDEVLRRIDKGYTHAEMVELCLKPIQAEIKMSAMVVLGLGGPRLSMKHAENSARLVDQIKPRFLSTLSLMTPPMQPSYFESFGDPEWRDLEPGELLLELRRFVECIESNGIIFRSNHASNYLSLAGTFQKGKGVMLEKIDKGICMPELLRPEYLRGL